MTAFLPLTDGAQVQIVFTLGGQVVSNRLWFVARQPPIDDTTLGALAQGVYDWHTSQVLPNLSSALQLAAVEAFEWNASPSPRIAVVNTVANGGASADTHSANIADRVWFYSSFNQGRIRNSHFIPGIPKDVVDTNRVLTPFRTAIFNAYVNLIDLASGFGSFPAWRWVCASSWNAGNLRSSLLARRTDFIVFKRPFVAQRRKRLPPYPS